MAARSGMAALISQVRQLAVAGSADYAVAGVTYWTDDQVQAILDRTRVELWEEGLDSIPQRDSGGTVRYTEYRTLYSWLEQTTGGTAIFYLTDSTGARIGTANYTVDYQDGRVTFGADQAGSARYVTARSYDVYEAAALVWESKAAQVSGRFDFTADGASFKASQLRTHYLAMAAEMRASSRGGGLSHARMTRSDEAGYPAGGERRPTRVAFG